MLPAGACTDAAASGPRGPSSLAHVLSLTGLWELQAGKNHPHLAAGEPTAQGAVVLSGGYGGPSTPERADHGCLCARTPLALDGCPGRTWGSVRFLGRGLQLCGGLSVDRPLRSSPATSAGPVLGLSGRLLMPTAPAGLSLGRGRAPGDSGRPFAWICQWGVGGGSVVVAYEQSLG